MESFPPIYIVSLPRSHERRQGIQRRLDALGRDYEIVDAVDGETVDWSQHTPRLRHRKSRLFLGRDMAAGEIGCYLSHYGLWERMLAEQTECALIMEDDAYWDDDFAEIIMQVMNAPWYWEVVGLVQSMWVPLDRVLCPLGDNRRLVRYLSRGLSTAAYLVRLEGAKKLCAYCRDMVLPIDYPYECWWRSGVAFYRVDPPPTQHESGYGKSVIWEKDGFCPTVPLHRKVLTVAINRWEDLAAASYARRHPPKTRRSRC